MKKSTPAITLEDVASYPPPGMAIPASLTFSPDDRLVTYLYSPGGSLVRQLFQFDLQSGEVTLLVAPPGEGATEENLSLEEKLRRERQRQLELGVTSYAWSERGNRLLIPLPDGVYVKDGPEGSLHKVADTENGPILDPQFSPDGDFVAYVQQSELYVVHASGGTPRQVTFGVQELGHTHGLAEFIAQEEMGRSQGFWWSPDSQWLAFEEVDETHIPVYRIIHQGKDAVGEKAQEDHRYPFAGQANARVRLGVVSRMGSEPVWMDLGPDQDIYLARVGWFSDGNLAVQTENREQTTLELVRCSPRSGERSLVLREISDIWINLHDMLRPIKSGSYVDGFLWASERNGFRHLYLYAASGQLIRQLTTGDWMVTGVCGVDESCGQVYFTGTKDGPTETHLYAVSLEGGQVRRITSEEGQHAVKLDHSFKSFVDVHDKLDQPPRITLRSLADGATIRVIYEQPDPRLKRLSLQPPELVTLKSRDGITLYGAIYRPQGSFGSGPYPTLVSVYGGPNAQMVTCGWRMTSAMRAQYLRQRGFLVFVLDNRGSARRGLAFEGAIKHNMGDLEVQDQVDGVRWLVAQGLADPERVGVYGWSYGGYIAAMCLARAPDTFRVAVAGAPVTSWDGYDTHYTERYMGTPQSNPNGYAESSVMHYVNQIKGRLILVHGLIDENVHFRHTARLINALIQARKAYSMLLFPDERHMPRRQEDRVFMEEQIYTFLTEALG